MQKLLIATALLTLLGAYIWLNCYFLQSLDKWFNLKLTIYHYILWMFPAIIAIFLTAGSHKFPEIVGIVASLWLGYLVISLPLLLIARVITSYSSIKPGCIGFIFILLSLLLSCYASYNAQNSYEIKQVKISDPNIPGPIKIALLADLHFDTHTTIEHVKRISDIIRINEPDIVVISGDFLNSKVDLKILNSLKLIKKQILMVTGNHDRAYDRDTKYVDSLAKINIKVLRNDFFKFRGINFLGIDFGIDSVEKRFNQIKKRSGFDEKSYKILLCHEPSNLKYFSEQNIDLMLSGHTHNGQIFPFNFIVKLVYNPIIGLSSFNNMSLYISQGTGTWGPRMRLGSKNEITLINLEKSVEKENKYLTLLNKSL